LPTAVHEKLHVQFIDRSSAPESAEKRTRKRK